MPKDWTGELVGLMHCHRITGGALAKELGVTNRYVSMILNGHRNPEGAEERFRAAIEKLIAQRNSDTEDVP